MFNYQKAVKIIDKYIRRDRKWIVRAEAHVERDLLYLCRNLEMDGEELLEIFHDCVEWLLEESNLLAKGLLGTEVLVAQGWSSGEGEWGSEFLGAAECVAVEVDEDILPVVDSVADSAVGGGCPIDSVDSGA